MLFAITLIIGGFVALAFGGEMLVRGASRLAQRAGISSLVIGLTVVAFGTSAPELAVSMKAGLAGQSDIAVGNVIGSNILNVLLILGLSALIAPLVVSRQLIRRDVPVMIAAAVLMLIMGWDGRIGRIDGLLLFAGLLVYIAWSMRSSRSELKRYRIEAGPDPTASSPEAIRSVWMPLVLLAIGLVILVLGARWLVDGAVIIARVLGMSELLIGLTIVAAGTSLPEVAASVVATLRGERDIAIGNVVGSNIFNILCVLGLSAAVSPTGLVVSSAALQLDLPVMLVVTVVCLPLFVTRLTIARWEGALLLFYYIAYTTYVVLAETRPDLSPTLGAMLLWTILPGTGVILLVNFMLAMMSGHEPDVDLDAR
ncbi:MAG: calcium/sodium antiporter [Pirellulaceae bacterium]